MVGKMTSRLELRLLSGGERNKGEGLASKLRGRDKVPVLCQKNRKRKCTRKVNNLGEKSQ